MQLTPGGHVADPEIYPILERTIAGERLGDADAERLFASHDLLALGRAAHAVRMRLHPEPVVTFIIDRNVNYTNVCVTDCSFCAFYRKAGDSDAYVRTRAELREKIEETYAAGGRQILMQGGLHPDLPFAWYEELLRWMKEEFPDLHIHAFSPTEISFFRDRFGLGLEEVITRLREAGLDSIPGGGAEILSDRVRNKISPDKTTADDWIEVMRVAHRLGMRTSATMMFGIIETYAERVEHLRRLRDLQDETGGFTCFIPLPFLTENSLLKLPPERVGQHVGLDRLRTVAVSRLMLDNIAHIKAYWVMMGVKLAQVALHYGANDLDGTIVEEKIGHMAGSDAVQAMTIAQLEDMIRRSGFTPVRRDTHFNPVEEARA